MAAEALDRLLPGDEPLHKFASQVESIVEPGELEEALVRHAVRLSGAARAELFVGVTPRWETDTEDSWEREPAVTCVATWPSVPDTTPHPEGAPAPAVLKLPLRCGDQLQGLLRVTARTATPWPARVVRRLTTLCTLAAAARRGRRPVRILHAESLSETVSPLRDEAFFTTMLPYSLAQSQRYREPLSLLCVAVDRLPSLERTGGAAQASAAVEHAGLTIVKTLRAGDVVARLDDDHLVALLVGAAPGDALVVGEAVRATIAARGSMPDGPALTVSVGVASYPSNAHDGPALIALATAALIKAQCLGGDRVASISPPTPTTWPAVSRAGQTGNTRR